MMQQYTVILTTEMARKKSNKERYNFLIDKDIYADFSRICDEIGFVRSRKVELFMKDFAEKNKETLRRLKNEK